MAREISTEDIRLGEEIREKTDPLAIFLTSADHNHFVMMWAARPILMGYPAWVANFGFLYEQRWHDLYTMFQGGPVGLNLLKSYNVSYVVIGSGEIKNYGADEKYFHENFELAFYNDNYRVYDIRKLITASFINQKN
ncbi:MAG: hypothetical protein NTW46_00080 [Candidatus Nealsonbacteria bacterium]|nr:hypothetical protein [Candidatus Nealsonbacteria bacterium]